MVRGKVFWCDCSKETNRLRRRWRGSMFSTTWSAARAKFLRSTAWLQLSVMMAQVAPGGGRMKRLSICAGWSKVMVGQDQVAVEGSTGSGLMTVQGNRKMGPS